MSAATDQDFLEAGLRNSEYNDCDDDQNDKLKEPAPSKYVEVNDEFIKDVDIDGTIIMDADGNYYYQSSESVAEVKPLPKTPGLPVKKVPAAVIPQIKRKNEVKTFKNPKLEDETIISEIGHQQKVYEFDENEHDADDPQDLIDKVYETRGIIKKSKSSNATEPVSFTCVVCSYETNKKFLLSRHLKTHSDDRPYKCDVCERGFKTKTALTNHRNIHLGRRPHACSSCDKAFTTSGELVRHMRYRHTHVKPHKCTECDYSSVELSKLRRHMRCHTGERPYQCPHCTYASPDTFKLKRHMRIHTGEKPYECDICHARFTQSNSLKHHRLIHSVSEKPVFQCQLCPTTCGRKTDLRLHIKNLHSSDQPLPCKRCGKELPDRYSYKMHIKTHEGEKCFRCKYCPYASISQRLLETHELIHFNAKPFTCDSCQVSFRQKQLLVRHTKIYHTKNYEPPKERKKDHKCPHCNKMFVFNGNLIRHMEIHDPTSKRIEEMDQLKLGRLKRVKPDGTVVTITPAKAFLDEFQGSEEFYYDYPEEEQQVEDEEIQVVELEETEIYNEDNTQFVYHEYEDDEGAEQDEEEENEDKQSDDNENSLLIDIKQENLQSTYINQVSLKNNIAVKNEYKTDAEILELEDQDDQGFMVIEVLPDDEDNDDQQQEEQKEQRVQSEQFKSAIISIKTNTTQAKNAHKSSQSLITNYFGFDVNEEKDEETKGAIQILEMIEQE